MNGATMDAGTVFDDSARENLLLAESLGQLREPVLAAINICGEAIAAGGKILLCGNGGSAADAQHIAAELVGRFECERRALPAIALTTNSSILTAVANDYGYDDVFARQVDALARNGDVLIAISTSGRSPNVISAVRHAREAGCSTIGMTGPDAADLGQECSVCISVDAGRTAVVQQGHIFVGHVICQAVEQALVGR